jgi:AcrR family transcriptional regulator
VSKEHGVRKGELLDVAQALFLKRGYDATSVNDIIVEAGVSKGTFYHYFASKEELLDAVVEGFGQRLMPRMTAAAASPELDALARLNAVFNEAGQWKAGHWDAVRAIVAPLYREENIHLRLKIIARTVDLYRPLIAGIVAEGVRKHVFDVGDPAGAADLLIEMLVAHRDATAAMLFREDRDPAVLAMIERRIRTFEVMVERFLGVKPGAIRLDDRVMLDAAKAEAS